MIEPHKAIESLQNRLNGLTHIANSQKFKEWKTRTLQTIAHIYGENHISYKALVDIKEYTYQDRTSEAKSEATELLEGLIENLNNFGFPKQNKVMQSGVNLHVNQQNNQNQTTTVSFNLNHFVDAIKDELKGAQIKELKAILDSDEEPEQKKKSFLERIKSFGSDISSNILANILTNPDVYTKIGGML